MVITTVKKQLRIYNVALANQMCYQWTIRVDKSSLGFIALPCVVTDEF